MNECELESTGAGQGSVAGFCTYGNEHCGPVNGVVFRDQLTACHVVGKTDNVLYSSHKNPNRDLFQIVPPSYPSCWTMFH